MSGRVTGENTKDRQTNEHDKQKHASNIFPPPQCQTTAFSSPPYMPHALPISSWLDRPTGEVYKSCSFKLYIFLKPPVTSSLTCPTVFASTLLLNTVRLCPLTWDQLSHPYKNTGKIIVLFLYIYIYIYRRQVSGFPKLNLFVNFPCM